ncbi:MAG: sugar phosphate isomerase/epimerase [Clostridia bacterium]|nr:sugar phosphate isomerase/epimerase [Clostridia bacterium]
MAQFLISAFADETSDDLGHQIEALKRNGVRCIELRNVNGGLIQKSTEELEEIARQLREAGITVSSLGSPIGKFKIDEDFEIHLADFRRALRACKIFGTKRMRMFSFFVPQERLAECRTEVMRRMKILLDMAHKEDITLCHENESRIYGQNPEEVRDLLENLPELRGIFDAANFVREGQDPIAGIEATLSSLEYLHIKDARFSDRAIVPCGMGDGQYPEVLRRVDALTDGLVYLTVEPHLHIFQVYQKIDSHKLLTGIEFDNADDAFDCAVTKLKETLALLGFHEEENQIWKK